LTVLGSGRRGKLERVREELRRGEGRKKGIAKNSLENVRSGKKEKLGVRGDRSGKRAVRSKQLLGGVVRTTQIRNNLILRGKQKK